ncbi:Ubiquitin carboxyl-terminal hydrolase, putative [Hondaea fermentalgiana]|uniref:Ubiquitin carboxyl-terminal hydrolase n=1 Tax=Hondaea fermentalgiana TaxID=2315210 RepID=A0A2R5G4X0_9STRA|nr:Ubiquitin carboxyl-terminal hydrolase, putative [Hondaea fermentalgiana]|eukprot:GBG26030.1 Ubiquitin carboxyl-terminal hydrolase, putative [Hondaea fermentalgiana]
MPAGPDAQAATAAGPLHTRDEVAAELESLLRKTPREAQPGTHFYLVSARWFSRWRKFVNGQISDPGPVDNSDLILADGEDQDAGGVFCTVKARLVENFDFRAVGPDAWNLIAEIFGGGPELPREVVQSADGEPPELDIYPVQVNASVADPITGTWRDEFVQRLFVSRTSSVQAFDAFLRGELSKLLAMDLTSHETCRLYGRLYGGDFVRIYADKEQASRVADAPWCDDNDLAQILVEIVREDGTWPHEQPRRRRSSSSQGTGTGAGTQKRPRNGLALEALDSDSRKRKGSLGDASSRPGYVADFTPISSGPVTLSRQLAPPPQSAFAIIPGTREQGNAAYGPGAQEAGRTAARANIGDNRSSATIGVVGLRNLGNTCFMNATLQCLNQAQKLTSYLIDEPRLRASLVDPSRRGGTDARSVARGLALASGDLSRMLWSSQHSVITPGGFLRVVASRNPIFGDGRQHDAHEFLMWLLNAVHDDTNQGHGTRDNQEKRKSGPALLDADITMTDNVPSEELARSRLAPDFGARAMDYADGSDSEVDSVLAESSRISRATESWRRQHEMDDSVILDFFQGQLESRLECEMCRRVSSTFDVFTTLSLPLGGPSHRQENGIGNALLSIEDCLAQYVETEHLGSNRFRADGSKITSVVRFGDKLDLEPFVSQEFQEADEIRHQFRESQSLEYSLFGVVRHSGSLRGGHYTAHVKAADGTWRLMNDSTVTTMPGPPDGLDDQAYMLFYSLPQ